MSVWLTPNSTAHCRLTRNLALLLAAGVPLVDSLFVLEEQMQESGQAGLLRKVRNHVESGGTLAAALSIHAPGFGRLYVNLVEVGEITGRLDEMLEKIADYLEQQAALKSQLTQLLSYPAFVLVMTLCVLIFLLVYVIPEFAIILRGADLPWPTVVLMFISEQVRSHSLRWVAIALLPSLAIVWVFQRSLMRRRVERLIVRFPLIGDIVRGSQVSRFCRTLGTMLESGIPLLNALEVAGQMHKKNLIRDDIFQMRILAAAGTGLTQSLRHSLIFPPILIRMLEVGEATSELPRVLLQIAAQYDRELAERFRLLASVLEPTIIILLGIMVGGVLAAIYLPVVEMTTTITGI